MEIRAQVRLAEFTSWLVGGVADWFCLPQNEEEIERAVRFALDRKIPWTILGGGTNVLISDKGIEGLVIGMKKFARTSVSVAREKINIECSAGTSKSELLKIFLKQKSPAALFLAGLPGDVGGGIVMNAGVSEFMAPREFHEIVDSFEVLRIDGENLQRRWFDRSEIEWSYRHSKGWQPGVVLNARLSWSAEQDPTILEKVKDANRARLSKQPLDLPSCGSVFVNPPGHKAARLIDESGLKGFSIGGAMVSPKHANFIVNTGGATAADIRSTIEHVRRTVKTRTGVDLVTEVVFLGRT